jgi:phosphate transport system substrate-binding protein
MRSRCIVTIALAAALATLTTGCAGDAITDLQGSGATFPAPLYKRWFLEYYQAHPDVQISYQAIGSGAGIRQFTQGLTIFGASDAAMNDKEIAEAEKKLGAPVLLLPMTAGSVVLSYNVPGVDAPLQLSRSAYTGIFLGTITSWNDAAIARINPDITLPDLPITVVRRADGSGTTFAFTNHLSAVSPAWKAGPGVSKSTEDWPTGIGGRGNSGCTALIQQTPGAIGYLEYGYAELAKLPMAILENRQGNYVRPGPESGKAALAGAIVPPNLRVFIPDPEGKDAYPIVTYTWMLCRKKYADAQTAQTLKAALRYCLTDGQAIAAKLGYIPLPENVASRVQAAVESIEP